MVYGARPDNPAFLTEDAPLRPPPSRALKDKADADADARRFAAEHPEIAVCIARLGAMVPVAPDHFWTRILSRRLVPAVLGYDPLLQLRHPDDAVAALVALWRVGARGPVNVVGRGYLPLSHILTRLGAAPLYLPAGVGQSLIGALWQAQLIEMPAHFLGYLRWPWLCDDHRLKSLTGFVPRHDLPTVLNILATSARARGDQGATP
jgi:UDP-glucose 4-epimerase